ncbi:MAG: hypothetical protein CSA81_06035 [Acidobacteria bacterium]|nr:MAG: hypothetical protein CSA81_06035 [Acidobacteriota bacterium]PIE89614.1 MAG: hypothetical protein CR997_10395 [Acidobacteriota bacterium]
MSSLKHAKQCELHPSRLTFHVCSSCKKAICRQCTEEGTLCSACKRKSDLATKGLNKKKQTKPFLYQAARLFLPSKVSLLLAFSLVCFLFISLFILDTEKQIKAPRDNRDKTQTGSVAAEQSTVCFEQKNVSITPFAVDRRVAEVNSISVPTSDSPEDKANLLRNAPFKEQQKDSDRMELTQVQILVPSMYPDMYHYLLTQPDKLNTSAFLELKEKKEEKSSTASSAVVQKKATEIKDSKSIAIAKQAEEKIKPSALAKSTRQDKNRQKRNNSMSSHILNGNRFKKYHLESVPTDKKFITLSFDGDHLDNCLDPIMQILAENNVKANVFLTGKFIKLFPEGVRKIVSHGHEIGNHTWNHPHLTDYENTRTHRTRKSMTRTQFISQLEKTAKVYQSVTGQSFSPYWRAPFGEHNLKIRTWAYSSGYLHIGWTRGCDSMDWMVNPNGKYYLSPAKLLTRLEKHLDKPGHKIILMHLGSKRELKERPHHILGEFIRRAKQKGYRFTTISEILRQTQGFQMASKNENH